MVINHLRIKLGIYLHQHQDKHRFSANGTTNAHDLGAIADWLFVATFLYSRNKTGTSTE